jgi:hypothetical protein
MQNPLCPPEMDAIILRALARDREERFQSAAEMADALDDIVHAARFQPTHLAHLMRELFPTDTAGGSGRVTGAMSMSGSQSRPHSSGMRSPTIPALSVSRPPTRPTYPTVDSAPIPLSSPGPSRRTLVVGAVLMVAAAGAGAAVMKSATPTVAGGATPIKEPQAKEFEIAVRSIPEGAEIWMVGENKYLGVTDKYLKFTIKDDAHISLVFKKEGYLDETREVSPYTMLVQLKEDPRKRGERPATKNVPLPEPTVPAPAAPSPSGVVPIPPSGSPPSGSAPSGAATGVGTVVPTPPPAPPVTPPKPASRRKTFRPNDTVNPFGGSAD